MTKSIKDLFEVYRPKAKDEADFVDKHVTIKHKDRNGNGDDVFKGNTKYIKRKAERHGYDAPEDEKVYEETEELDEINNPTVKSAPRGYGSSSKKPVSNGGTWTSKNKDRGGNYEQPKIYASAMRKEEVEELDELSRKTLGTYGSKALRAGLSTDNEATRSKRLKGANLASAKLYPSQYEKSPLKAKVVAKEEVEDLEELSRATIGRYSMKAKSIADNEGGKDRTKSRELAGRKKWGGTMSGVKPARVMATEEVNLDEAKDPEWKRDKYGARHLKTKGYHAHADYNERFGHHNWVVNAPNGKEIASGSDENHTDMHSKVMKAINDHKQSMKEEVELDEMRDLILNSLINAAEELGEEFDIETLNSIAEEVLGELSVSTLKSYRTKARADAYDADDVDDERRFRKRAAGSNLSGKKIIKKGGSLKTEEVELEEATAHQRVLAHPAVHSVDDGGPGDYFVNLKKGYHYSGQRAFGNDSPTKALKILKQVKSGHIEEEAEDLDESVAKAANHLIKRYGDNVRKSHVRSAANDFGVGFVALSHHVRKKLGVNRLEEEQIDELTYDTMLNYRHKARKAIRDVDTDDKTLDKREKGWDIAGRRMMAKIRKEEAEQIDELSPRTLGNYVKRSQGKLLAHGMELQRGTDRVQNTKDAERKINNRFTGVTRATNKLVKKALTKEDIINRAIERYIPEDIELPSMEDRLLDKLEGYDLSESNIHILLSVFDNLNEQNQHRMLENVNTIEGVNSLLDFAISNRGE